MGYGAAEATGLGFFCFAIINLRVLSANRVDSGFFPPQTFFNFTPPPWPLQLSSQTQQLASTSGLLQALELERNFRMIEKVCNAACVIFVYS